MKDKQLTLYGQIYTALAPIFAQAHDETSYQEIASTAGQVCLDLLEVTGKRLFGEVFLKAFRLNRKKG